MARNPISKGGKRWAVKFANLKETQVTFRQLSDAVSGVTGVRSNLTAAAVISSAFKEVSEYLRDKIKSSAASKGVPNRVQAAVFAFTDLTKGKTARKQRSTLVGVRKGAPPRKDSRLYVEWNGTGKTIGMSLATIFEKGTTRGIKPTRFFRTALFSSRSYVLQRLTAAYKTAIESLNR